MAWIKRNLFFVIGIAVALVLLAVAGVYDFKSLAHNSDAKDRLSAIYTQIQQLGIAKPSPGNDKINNIQAAREQEGQIREWVNRARNYFKPIAPIPNNGRVSNQEAFANALRRTIHTLQQESAGAGVTLPPDYSFSFTAQRILVRFAPGSLQGLAEQLGEVQTLSEILFAARVNSIDSIQRVRVSDDDTAGPQADYVNDSPVTNNLAIITPYAITFRSFSGDLATVLAGFASSPHGFIVKGVNVSPAMADAAAPAAAPPLVAGRGGLPTVLDEQLLRVTLEIEIVKLQP